MNVEIRPATPQEISSYVVPTWLSSYALSFVGKLCRADSRHGVGRAHYWSEQRGRIERALSTSSTAVNVADVDGEPVGWCCFSAPDRKIHYLFVNRVFRRQGIGSKLLPAFYNDHTKPVFLTSLPPPFYSRPANDGTPPPWPSHVCITLL